MKPKEIDVVELTLDIPYLNLKKGEQGAIISVFTYPEESYEVEFVNEDGTTKVICVLKNEQLHIVWES